MHHRDGEAVSEPVTRFALGNNIKAYATRTSHQMTVAPDS